MNDYEQFLDRKSQLGIASGFAPIWMPDFLFDFQRALVEWAIRKGRAAIFADCVAGETIVSGPDGEERIDVLAGHGQPFRVWSLNRRGERVATHASAAWMNGYAPLYRFLLASGRSVVATSGHRFLTGSGWKRGASLGIGERLAVSAPGPPVSTAARAQSILRGDALHWTRTTPDSSDDCSVCSCLGDGQPRSILDNGPKALPSRADAPGRDQPLMRADDLAHRSTRSRPHRDTFRPSMTDFDPPGWSSAAIAGSRLLSFAASSSRESNHSARQAGEDTSLSLQVLEPRPSATRLFAGARCVAYEASWDSLVSVDYIRDDVFFDLEVPEVANYLADGIWSHNCGLGKTPCQLVWAENIVRHENKPVLILTPLAVSYQTLREAEKFGIEAHRSQDGTARENITITNYERLGHFKADDFAGVVCDESGILKSFDGVRRGEITEFMRKVPYRLLCTATAAPNDYTELGTSSEALGELGHMDMLNRFFKNDQNTSDTRRKWTRQSGRGEVTWRFRGHAEVPFWRWVCSWARSIRRPSDLGFSDEGFILPSLIEQEHIIEARNLADGMLFTLPAIGLYEQREERRRTIKERCEAVAALVAHTGQPALLWCHLNPEGDLLADLIPDAVQISGKDSDEAKEEAFLAFADGTLRVLVSKQRIAGWGMNWEHCAHIAMFPSHSFEATYQGIRRCWRYGQTRAVVVDTVLTEGEKEVLKNLRRKATAADRMFSSLVAEMNRALSIERGVAFTIPEEIPAWLS